MVACAFGRDAGALVTVWARDTLGFVVDEYHCGVQTTKDVAWPWAVLGPYAVQSALLLDDSRAKAARQPHNSLCVPKYAAVQCREDLAALAHAASLPEPGAEADMNIEETGSAVRSRRHKEKAHKAGPRVHRSCRGCERWSERDTPGCGGHPAHCTHAALQSSIAGCRCARRVWGGRR
ncbi:hypothetical protein BC834DRAFT_311483 [Gloeopeniophorella convolvens]|nr:hypothetical protein BC834DRAFT_311483 [Gloeopeniophorella convolvens]